MANHTARGQQRDKPFRDALRMEIAEAKNHKALRRIAKALLMKAEEGDISAIREVADRLDGKVPQAITGADDTPLIPDFTDEQRAKALAVLLAKGASA